MGTNTKYRKKLVVFICGALLLLSLEYVYGFRNTKKARMKVIYLHEQSDLISQSARLKEELERKLDELDSKLGDIQVVDDDQEFILSTVHNSYEKNMVRVIEVTNTSSQTENGITKNTYGATLEGNFTDLVKEIRTFEESGHEGKIASITFSRYVDNKSKKIATRLKFFIQEYNAN